MSHGRRKPKLKKLPKPLPLWVKYKVLLKIIETNSEKKRKEVQVESVESVVTQELFSYRGLTFY